MTIKTGYQKMDMSKGEENWKQILVHGKKEILEALNAELNNEADYRKIITHIAITVDTDSDARCELIDTTSAYENKSVEDFIDFYKDEDGTQIVAIYTVSEIRQMKQFSEADRAKWAMDLVKFQFAA